MFIRQPILISTGSFPRQMRIRNRSDIVLEYRNTIVMSNAMYFHPKHFKFGGVFKMAMV